MPVFDHSDYCHCLDYDPEKCPESCFRAIITKDLKESGYPYPVYFSYFKECADICERPSDAETEN